MRGEIIRYCVCVCVCGGGEWINIPTHTTQANCSVSSVSPERLGFSIDPSDQFGSSYNHGKFRHNEMNKWMDGWIDRWMSFMNESTYKK
jgi:hypothetical protein